MKTQNYYGIVGMHCASCASIIERTLKKIDGVETVSVNSGTERAHLVFDTSKIDTTILNEKLAPLGYTLRVSDDVPESGHQHDTHKSTANDTHDHAGSPIRSKQEKLNTLAAMKSLVYTILPLAGISIIVMIWDILAQYAMVPEMSKPVIDFFHHLLPLFATYTLFVAGKPYLLGLYRFLRYGTANMDTLIGIGTTTAFLYSFIISAFEEPLRPFIANGHSYYDVTIVVIAFITLGKYLEMRSKLKTGDALEKLMNLQVKTAWVIRDGNEYEVPLDTVAHNDLIIIKPGARIPVDGIVTEGSSFIDESMITGEPMPVKKEIGDTVIAGTINTNGSLFFTATKIGPETLLAQIITMVEEAQESKAPIQALADKISSIFVPVVLVIALITLGSWLIFGSSSLGFSQALSYGLVSFVGVLIIACPCALGLATPTAIIVGVGKGARSGILVKDAATLEKLHTVDTVIVDKTGTITVGKPTVVDVKNFSDQPITEIIGILASLEKKSEHPIAHAIVQYAQEQNIEFSSVTHFEAIQGKGITGTINKVDYFIGTTQLVTEHGPIFDATLLEPFTAQGKTPIIIGTREKVLAMVMVADTIKTESKEAVQQLQNLGIKVIMATGDNQRTANYVASLVGIHDVFAQGLPKDKLTLIKKLQTEGHRVAMAGDGVNDAPALAQADVGIAMGTGTDVAIASAGITLLGGDLSKLVQAIHLSRITMQGVKQNLFWAFIYNSVGIPLAAGVFYPIFGWLLNPVFAGIAMALSSVSVVSNSLRIKNKKLS